MLSYGHSDYAHGIMFHHFTDDKHPRGQGAIDATEMETMIRYLDPARILTAEEWFELHKKGGLKPYHLCITFDDSLLCQFDVAKPVLDHFGLKAFFFVYSSIFEGKKEKLEIYRYFRTKMYPDIDSFYDAFLQCAKQSHETQIQDALEGFNPENFLADYPFFSRNDRIFRYLRDYVLTSGIYESIMDSMIRSSGMNTDDVVKDLWMSQEMLRTLDCEGHVIGLHSYTHPTVMAALPAETQKWEYGENSRHLTTLLGKVPTTMSHPCSSYNSDTLDLLDDMGIQMGFCADMTAIRNRGIYELPRQDHANIRNEMRS